MTHLAADYLARVEGGLAARKAGKYIAECLCARLTAEGRLTERQFMAAARFREAHHRASRGVKLTHAWPKALQGRLQPAYRVPTTEALSRARAAYESLLGPLSGALAVAALAMAVYDRAPLEYGAAVFQYRERHAAAAAGLVSLIHALDILADALRLPE